MKDFLIKFGLFYTVFWFGYAIGWVQERSRHNGKDD
jgi:hypothetical protein